jgi:hypothetical protein
MNHKKGPQYDTLKIKSWLETATQIWPHYFDQLLSIFCELGYCRS